MVIFFETIKWNRRLCRQHFGNSVSQVQIFWQNLSVGVFWAVFLTESGISLWNYPSGCWCIPFASPSVFQLCKYHVHLTSLVIETAVSCNAYMYLVAVYKKQSTLKCNVLRTFIYVVRIFFIAFALCWYN